MTSQRLLLYYTLAGRPDTIFGEITTYSSVLKAIDAKTLELDSSKLK